MCRLLGVVARTPAALSLQLTDEIGLFVDLSNEHAHGWGIGYRDADGQLRVDKEPVCAADSDAFRASVDGIDSDAALLHIRQASPGMPLTMDNTHPFLADELCFAHNGYAWPAQALDVLVVEADAPRPTGDTDSERYLSLVRAGLRERAAPDALRDAAALIAERGSATSLNCLLLTPDALYALAWWHASTIRSQPDGETERDYRLWYRVDPDRVVVASAGIPGETDGWQELPDGNVLEIRRADLAAIVHQPS